MQYCYVIILSYWNLNMMDAKYSQSQKYNHRKKIELKKSPVEMEYDELDVLLDFLLTSANLSSKIDYSSDQINYDKKRRFWLLLKAVYRLFIAQLFYMKYMKKKVNMLKNLEPAYTALRKTRCLKNLRTYLYLSKVGLTDLAKSVGGKFDDKLFANFTIATMLYDASFDIQVCRKYLKDFDEFIMNDRRIVSQDEYLSLFQESVDYLRDNLGETAFNKFMNYVKIEHISQLMSIYQLSDKYESKEDLMKITFAKGGISALALMYLMAPNMNEKERKAIYELGAVMQIIDDISDMKEDLKTGISTLPNKKLLSYQELKKMYSGTVNNLMKKCNMKANRPNGTLDMLCWFDDIILEKRYDAYLKSK